MGRSEKIRRAIPFPQVARRARKRTLKSAKHLRAHRGPMLPMQREYNMTRKKMMKKIAMTMIHSRYITTQMIPRLRKS
jgi:hypothetical protein